MADYLCPSEMCEVTHGMFTNQLNLKLIANITTLCLRYTLYVLYILYTFIKEGVGFDKAAKLQ